MFTSSPFDGVKGQRWHQFEQAFKAGAAAEFAGEDDESMWDACIDIDTGGNGTGATPMPAAGAALAKAQRLFAQEASGQGVQTCLQTCR